MNWSDLQIDKSWTLFLDRDGVINKKIDGDYVRNISQFEWLPGVQDALVTFSARFGRIIIITNQQGVGKKLMTHEDVELIHDYILQTAMEHGGKIDAVYFAPQLKGENSEFRKPNIGMAKQALKDFPGIVFSKSVMVGDSMSDMEFGKNAGMKTVYILNGRNHPDDLRLVDSYYDDLAGFSKAIALQS